MNGLDAWLILMSIGCMALFQRKAMRGKHREKIVVSVLLLLALSLTLFLLIFPEVPGPTDWMIVVFESLHLPTVR